MSPLISRLAIVAAGLPIVLGSAYLGCWFLFALVALGGLIALHELYRLARPLRPLVLAGYGGALAAFFGAEISGAEWMLAGFLLTFVLSFVFAAVSETRQSATVAIATTIFGAAWIGLGLGHLLLVRELDTYGRLALITMLLTVFVTDTFAYVGGTRCHRSFRRGRRGRDSSSVRRRACSRRSSPCTRKRSSPTPGARSRSAP
jgi:CDP-diglyceride synthetase